MPSGERSTEPRSRRSNNKSFTIAEGFSSMPWRKGVFDESETNRETHLLFVPQASPRRKTCWLACDCLNCLFPLGVGS